MDIPTELYKIIASMVKTLQCYKSLSLVCKNSSIGCHNYIIEAERRSHINVQIIYSKHGILCDGWYFGHLPLPVSHSEFSTAINRVHIACDALKKDSRCSKYSYPYYSSSENEMWIGQQKWNIRKLVPTPDCTDILYY